MSHAEFNESVIGRLIHNDGWRKEKLARDKGRRVSVRVSDSLSSLTEDSFEETLYYHNMALIDQKYESKSNSGKKKAFYCRWCISNKGEKDEKLKAKRTRFYCKECSDVSLNDEAKVFLHPECMASFHNWMSDQSRLL